MNISVMEIMTAMSEVHLRIDRLNIVSPFQVTDTVRLTLTNDEVVAKAITGCFLVETREGVVSDCLANGPCGETARRMRLS